MLQLDKIELSTTQARGDVIRYFVKQGWTQPAVKGKPVEGRAFREYDGYRLECVVDVLPDKRTVVRAFAIRKRMDGINRAELLKILTELGFPDE